MTPIQRTCMYAMLCALGLGVDARAQDAVAVDGEGNTSFMGAVTAAGMIAAPNVLSGAPGISINTSQVLNATAFGNWHWISGIANTSITLPTAVGNAGKHIGFRALDASQAPKIYTLVASSGQFIDGMPIIPLVANSTLVVMSDGLGWARVAGSMVNVYVEATSDAGQAMSAATTVAQFEDEVADTHDAWNGSTFTAPISGVYSICVTFGVTTNTANLGVNLYKNGVQWRNGAVDASSGFRVNTTFVARIATGDALTLRSNATATRATAPANNSLTILRVSD